MYDTDMDAETWKSYRRSLKWLFKVLYGSWPTIKSVRRKDVDYGYKVTIESPVASCTILAGSKMSCFNYLLEAMQEKLEDDRRDWDDDEWLATTKERLRQEKAEEEAEEAGE